jgi:hypothetical protein
MGSMSLSGQTKDYKIDICCFSTKHAVLKEWVIVVWIQMSYFSGISWREQVTFDEMIMMPTLYCRVKPKTIKLIFVVSPLSTQSKGERAKNGWLGIRIMCQSGATCLSMDCCYAPATITHRIYIITLSLNIKFVWVLGIGFVKHFSPVSCRVQINIMFRDNVYMYSVFIWRY